MSPDTTGPGPRAGDTAAPASAVGSPAPPGAASDCPPRLGEPVAFSLSRAALGSDAGVGCHFRVILFLSGWCSSQTIAAPVVSAQQGRWSSAMPQTRDVSREGLFDAYCASMDTGDCPLVCAGLPGCPYRIASYTGPAAADTNPAFDIQMHHPRFLEFIGAPEPVGCYSGLRPFGFRTWIQRMLSRPPSSCNVTPA